MRGGPGPVCPGAPIHRLWAPAAAGGRYRCWAPEREPSPQVSAWCPTCQPPGTGHTGSSPVQGAVEGGHRVLGRVLGARGPSHPLCRCWENATRLQTCVGCRCRVPPAPLLGRGHTDQPSSRPPRGSCKWGIAWLTGQLAAVCSPGCVLLSTEGWPATQCGQGCDGDMWRRGRRTHCWDPGAQWAPGRPLIHSLQPPPRGPTC